MNSHRVPSDSTHEGKSPFRGARRLTTTGVIAHRREDEGEGLRECRVDCAPAPNAVCAHAESLRTDARMRSASLESAYRVAPRARTGVPGNPSATTTESASAMQYVSTAVL